MKNVLCLCLFFFVLRAGAQVVERNDVVISIAPGITLSHYGSVETPSPLSADLGLSGMRAPVSVSYLFGRKFGISADFVYTLLDTKTRYPSNLTALDFGLGLRWYDPGTKRKINWFGEIGWHYSSVHYFFHSGLIRENMDAKGWGLYYDAGANVPFSADGKFGIGISLNGGGYKYKKTHYENDSGGSVDFQMNALSFAMGINLYCKL